MSEFEGRVKNAMDAALDATFSGIRYGGDHESRKLIAARLVEAARAGQTTLDELICVGRRAMIDFAGRSAP
jgi:hypothetical protein